MLYDVHSQQIGYEIPCVVRLWSLTERRGSCWSQSSLNSSSLNTNIRTIYSSENYFGIGILK